MGAKMVILHGAAPVCIDHPFAAFARTDAVLPVVFIRKAAARPAEHRNLDFLKRFHNIVADTLCIGNRRIFAHPDAFIDTASQMFSEMSVDVAVNGSFADVRVQYHAFSHLVIAPLKVNKYINHLTVILIL